MFKFTGTYLLSNSPSPRNQDWAVVENSSFTGDSLAYSWQLNGERHLLFKCENGAFVAVPLSKRNQVKVA